MIYILRSSNHFPSEFENTNCKCKKKHCDSGLAYKEKHSANTHLITPLLFIVKYLTIAYSYTKVKMIDAFLNTQLPLKALFLTHKRMQVQHCIDYTTNLESFQFYGNDQHAKTLFLHSFSEIADYHKFCTIYFVISPLHYIAQGLYHIILNNVDLFRFYPIYFYTSCDKSAPFSASKIYNKELLC